MQDQNKELKQFKETLKHVPRNERGIIMMITLVMLVMVTVIGLVSIRTSSTEVKLGGNERIAKEVLFAAESGIQHARRAIKGVGFTAALLANQPWLSVNDFNGISYTVRVTNTNSRDIAAPQNSVFLTSQATYPNGYTRTIEAEVYDPLAILPINYSLGAVGNFSRIRFRGGSVVKGNLPDGLRSYNDAITGEPITIPEELVDPDPDNTCAQNKAGVAVDNMTSFEEIEIDNSINVTGSPDIQLRAADMTPTMIQDMSADMAQYADRVYHLNDDNDGNVFPGVNLWGTKDDPQITTINMTGNDIRTTFDGDVKGYGILIINADDAMKRAEIKFDSDFEWHGVIIVTGSSRFRLRDDSGGDTTTTIIGSLLAANTSDDGAEEQVRLRLDSPDTLVQYSCDAISATASTAASIMLNSWHEITQS
ncbi:MAG: pilus assembly PilX N-terminal domain-containing protein [Nitrospira sp.]|nr:hypothetical protein [Candidatus Manganitrophaceae bacterium]HIL34584.1 hypothetical protein [Candidatus Manganitrophaceae bacterium]